MIMNKKIYQSYSAYLQYVFLLQLALYPNTSFRPEKYSTDGLEMDFNVK